MKKHLISLLFFIMLLPAQAQAQRVSTAQTTGGINERIAAVVNDSVISTVDVRGRLALALLTSGLPDTMEIKQKLLPQVIRSLIDEQLQMQEGKRIEVTVSADEVRQALEKIEKQNNVPNGDLATFLNSRGVPEAAIVAQAKAALTWNKVVQRELRPKVDIGDDEIQSAMDRLNANAGKPEYLVSEIFLPVDAPKDEEQVKTFADGLFQQIKNGGNFASIAYQFSRSTGAASGGDIGWVQDGQLPQELNKALTSANKGDLIGPIRSASGFHILGIRDQRTVAISNKTKDIAVTLKQAFLLFPAEANKDQLLKEVERFRSSVSGCDALADTVKKDFPTWIINDLGEVKLDTAPEWLVENTHNIPVGRPGKPITSGKGALVLLVCGRKAENNIDRGEIIASIGTERLELQARRLMRDLRRAAYIDVRLNYIP